MDGHPRADSMATKIARYLLDFFLWGFLKNKMYKEAIDSRETLLQRIDAAFAKIRPIHHATGILAYYTKSIKKESINYCDPSKFK